MCTTDRAVRNNKYIYKAFFSWLISTSISESNLLKMMTLFIIKAQNIAL